MNRKRILLTGIAVFHAYATYPIPLDLTLKWYFSGLVMSMILGVVASLVYKPGAPRLETRSASPLSEG